MPEPATSVWAPRLEGFAGGLRLLAGGKLRTPGAIVFAYHDIGHDRNGPASYRVSPSRLRQQLECASDWGVRFVDVAQLASAVAAGEDIHGLGSIVFDDGLVGVHHHALPLLAELGLPATIFAVSGALGSTPPWWDGSARVMTRREVQEAAGRGGSHRIAQLHPSLTSIAGGRRPPSPAHHLQAPARGHRRGRGRSVRLPIRAPGPACARGGGQERVPGRLHLCQWPRHARAGPFSPAAAEHVARADETAPCLPPCPSSALLARYATGHGERRVAVAQPETLTPPAKPARQQHVFRGLSPDRAGQREPSPAAALVSNTGSLLASKVVVATLSWIGTVLIARSLSLPAWGQYSFVFSFLGILTIVTNSVNSRVAIRGLLDDPDPSRFAGTYIVLRAALGAARLRHCRHVRRPCQLSAHRGAGDSCGGCRSSHRHHLHRLRRHLPGEGSARTNRHGQPGGPGRAVGADGSPGHDAQLAGRAHRPRHLDLGSCAGVEAGCPPAHDHLPLRHCVVDMAGPCQGRLPVGNRKWLGDHLLQPGLGHVRPSSTPTPRSGSMASPTSSRVSSSSSRGRSECRSWGFS